MFKFIHGFEDFDISRLVSFNDNTTRGHSLKLNKPRCMKTLRSNTFPVRGIDNRNKLPDNLVCSKTVDTFKKTWRHMERNKIWYQCSPKEVSLTGIR